MAARTVTTAVVALVLAAGADPGATTSATLRAAARRDVSGVPAADVLVWVRPAPHAVPAAPAARPPKPARVRPVVKPVHVTPLDPDPYFRTPEAAMRYLAAAYNRRDDDALRHVTTPHARAHLEAMRDVATDLRLVSCERWPNGQHLCTFTHAYPKAKGRGPAELLASPAARRGWFMTALESCG